MSAGFIALAVATNNFGAGGFRSRRSGGSHGSNASSNKKPVPSKVNTQFSSDVWEGDRVLLNFIPVHGQETSLMSCYAIDENGTKWKVSQGTFLKTDRS